MGIKTEYVTILDFMVEDLKLEGTELMIYAIIYGFSQGEEQEFRGTLKYLMKWTNKTKKSCIENLKKLIEKNLIIKKEVEENGRKVNSYGVNFTPLKREANYTTQKCKNGKYFQQK